MNIIQIYKRFPTHEDCIKHLEQVRWNGKPTCPYCHSTKSTPVEKENRHHCNTCNTSYSVTVNTIFHSTKLDLQKWFLAISLILNAKKGISSRQLGRHLEVTKDTAWRMQMQIRSAFLEYGDLLEGIVEADETYIGGKNKNRHKHKKTKGGQGRGGSDKTPVIGLKQRGGKVVARKSKDVSGKSLKGFIKQNVKKGATLSTDEWRGYSGLAPHYKHVLVSHGKGEYVNGIAHTNGIENFWSLLKRGVIGQYHWVSDRYLDLYVTEFSYRYNNRNTENIFDIVMKKAVFC